MFRRRERRVSIQRPVFAANEFAGPNDQAAAQAALYLAFTSSEFQVAHLGKRGKIVIDGKCRTAALRRRPRNGRKQMK